MLLSWTARLGVETQVIQGSFNLRRADHTGLHRDAGAAGIEIDLNVTYAVNLAQRLLNAGGASAAGHALHIEVESLHRSSF